MADESNGPDKAKDLTALVGELLAANFRIDTRQYLLAHELMLALALDGEELLKATPERIAACVGPIFCTSPEEQDRFVAVVRQWRGREAPDTVPKASPKPEPQAFKSWRQSKWLARAVVIAMPLIGVAGVAAFYYLVPVPIAGKVTKEGQPAQPEPAADAALRLGGVTQAIAADGSFSIEVARARSLPLEASLEGFQTIAINVTGSTTAPVELHFKRAPSPTELSARTTTTAAVSVYTVSLPIAGGERVARRDIVIFGAIAAGVLAWIVLQAAERKRRDLALMRLPKHEDGEQVTLQATAPPSAGVNEQEIRGAAVAIRRLRDEKALVLHLGGTIEATVRNAGLFSPHMVPRRAAPEYLMLVSQRGKEDHQARLFTGVFDAFEAQGVALDVYWFRDDPRTCIDENGEGYRLAQLISRHHRSTLLVCAETGVAFNRGTGAMAPWVDTTKTLDARVYVTPEPPFRWSAFEFALIDAGWVVLPASDAGWHRLGELGIIERPLESPDYERGFPSVIGVADRRWLDRNEPPPDIVEKLLRQVEGYLGDEGFAWLCACAVYPEISWPLTLAVARTPPNNALLPLLARLPWFRNAYMPDWLRLVLVTRIAPDDEARIHATLATLLEELVAKQSAPADETSSPLPISPLVGPVDVLRAAPPDSALSDAILLGFVANASLSPLMVRAPSGLGRQFQTRLAEFATSRQPSRPLGNRVLRRLRSWSTFYPARVRLSAAIGLAVVAWFVLPPLVTEARVSDGREPIWFINVPSNEIRLSEASQAAAVPLLRVPDIFMSRTEVTVAQYRACATEGQCTPADRRALEGPDDWPVRYISASEALQYCAWLEQRLKTWVDTPEPIANALGGRGSDGRVWRVTLPSEPEWELAARGTDGRTYPWGDAPESYRANFSLTGLGQPTPVGTFLSGESPHRLLDMSGNVREWTRSAWRPYPYAADDGREDPRRVTDTGTATRGGDYSSNVTSIATGARALGPVTGDAITGLRVVISPLTLAVAVEPSPATALPSAPPSVGNPGPTRGRSFRPVDLVASTPIQPNWRLNWLTGSTFDVIDAGTVEFVMAKNREVIALRATFNENAPQAVTLKANARRVVAVHLLVTGSYVVDVARGVRIGRIRLIFAKGGIVDYNLVNGVNLREGWEPKNAITQLPSDGVPGVTWRNLTEQPQLRGNIDAVGYLDMLSLRIPAEYATADLTAISLEDTAGPQENVKTPGRVDPSFIVSAITIEAAQPPTQAR